MAEALWTLREVVKAAGGEIIGSPPHAFTGVSIDSRTVRPGEIFVAIRGDTHDGHDFVSAAHKAGAGLAVVSRQTPEMAAGGGLLVVDDPLKALERLGIAARARSQAQIVAVTGSVGKTGTKEALRLCLSASGETHASAASYNNHWGVPLSLARLSSTARFAVFEIGMNHAGEITPLVAMVRPHIAIITTIAPVHLGPLGSIEAIADAKAEIFTGLEPKGVAILNRDIGQFERLEAAAKAAGVKRIVTFGEHEAADARLRQAGVKEICTIVQARILGQDVTYRVGAPGRHIAVNSLAVLAAIKCAGGDLALGALKLRELEPPKGRGARFKLRTRDGDITVIDESYNANPVSMRAALALLGHSTPGPGGRRIAVMGDMLELGPESRRFHGDLAGAIDAAGVDVVYACGPDMKSLWDALRHDQRGYYATSSQDLADPLLDGIRAGDVIMVKGSLGSRMGLLIDALRRNFAEIEANAA
ncbi:UDP-N-acetylmuramoylalanyl-D-glutamyl-2,6-diaminopimelate--D-alanyl-D-alanine ligase [Rhodoligotrophos defluvii]|uniref:UDP-N-acetylmuramoylalanyl-D-glutamyl-2, 6-diaminopimelate--D-alanyl-D-alanine ligase n=1 Tax=Rhodoligotrophos defluvii TaxID=2561934 RepID=UPI0010C96601|nr:UDP-N-acetylmuramoylalanyl-D-glutamyl-2,6-diaminopimelate--D-alanyl-D-alanine ligase [Rhodoligotrophos defluvii]